MSQNHHTVTEELKISADKLVDTIRDLIHSGNVTHVVIKNHEGHTIFEIPVTVGLIGFVLAPMLAAIGALAVYAADYTVVVTRSEPPPVI